MSRSAPPGLSAERASACPDPLRSLIREAADCGSEAAHIARGLSRRQGTEPGPPKERCPGRKWGPSAPPDCRRPAFRASFLRPMPSGRSPIEDGIRHFQSGMSVAHLPWFRAIAWWPDRPDGARNELRLLYTYTSPVLICEAE